MTAIKLKNLLVRKISKIRDEDFLNAIRVIIESKEQNDEIYILNETQKKRIKKSRMEFSNGLGIPHEKAMKDINLWLKEK